jgi:hypothetical protein
MDATMVTNKMPNFDKIDEKPRLNDRLGGMEISW